MNAGIASLLKIQGHGGAAEWRQQGQVLGAHRFSVGAYGRIAASYAPNTIHKTNFRML